MGNYNLTFEDAQSYQIGRDYTLAVNDGDIHTDYKKPTQTEGNILKWADDTHLKWMSKKIHEKNVEKGFYDKSRELGTMLMLIVSELSEALEADRNGRHCDIEEVAASHDISDPVVFKGFIKDSFEDELADVFIRMFDLCGYLGLDIQKYIDAKLKYNEQREHKHGKSY
jgi:NTP pyrophosphatase (non-canonical NTP hydrolase)